MQTIKKYSGQRRIRVEVTREIIDVTIAMGGKYVLFIAVPPNTIARNYDK
jgi:hypothetical protein